MKLSCSPLIVSALSCSFALALVGSVAAQPPEVGMAINPAPNLAEEGEAWGAYTAYEKTLGDLPRTDPKAAIAGFESFSARNPELHPIVAALIASRVAALYRDGLKNPDKALDIYAQGLEKYRGQPAASMMIEGQTRTLFERGDAAGALAFVEKQWPQMVTAEQGGHPYLRGVVSRALQWRVRALLKLDRSGPAIALLKSSLSQMPSLLDPQHQTAEDWSEGWIYGELVDLLVAQKQSEDALRWAKLGYAEAAFDKGAIERASQWPGRVWAAQGDFVAARGFALAQDDPKRANPLAKIALPELDETIIGARLKLLRESQSQNYESERVPDIVGLQIGIGQLKTAMEDAQALLIKYPTAPQGVEQIARVFKAADGNLVRANQFIAYLDGNAANPLPEFWQTADAAPTATLAVSAQNPANAPREVQAQ